MKRASIIRSALLAADVDVNLDGNESHMVIHPTDPEIVAVSLCFRISLSFDGGRTFNVADQVPLVLPPGYGGAGCDDVLAFDGQGRLFVTFLSQTPCTDPTSPFCNSGFGGIELFVQQVDARRPGTAVASRLLDATGNDCTGASANAAQCPSNVTRAIGRGACDNISMGNGRSADRQWLTADARPPCAEPPPARATRTCSPFSGNLYVIWTDSSCGNAPASGMMVAASPDQGANWNSQALLAGTGPNQDVRQPGLGIGANGDMYAGYHAQGYNPEPDGMSGQIFVFQSTDGTATGLAGNQTIPFPAPTVDFTIGRQQCVCPGSTCAATGAACSFTFNTCPGAGCECGAGDVCNPAASCANNPTAGWAPCARRLQTNGNLTWGSQSPFIVGDPANPNNVAVFASIENNLAGTVRDNLDIGYVIATNAATALPTWSAIQRVFPNGAALPVSNQLFPMAVTGLTGSCVTIAYYDDRSPTTNAQGNNLLDTFVTVNPNIWTGRTWQPEVLINDVPFDADRAAPDFFRGEYCGSNPACVTPAGWRAGSRMGEYNGVVLAGGYSFVNDPVFGQETMFDFSDGIPPVVTAPGPITIGTCRPGQAQLGTGTATDECGKPPLSAVTPNNLVLGLGANTVTWTATDGADNVGTATQTVTVTDSTGPSFTVIPGDITTTSCTGVSLGFAFAQDDCGGNVTITNNAPAQFPLGTTTVTWTAVDARGNSRTATQRVTALLGDNPSCCPPGTNIILGKSNNNTLNGTANADCILGRGAQDTINGNGGNDFISGGDGDDNINGGRGNDSIFGGSGQDTIIGGIGNDTL